MKVILTVSEPNIGRKEFPVSDVSAYVVETAMDQDADPFSIDVPDPDNFFDFLKDRDVEIVADIFTDSGDGRFIERMHKGFMDDLQYDSADRVLSIQGRDFSALATDSDVPPQSLKHVFLGDIIKPRALGLGFNDVTIPATSSFARVYTDGSESEWQFWYRLAREKDFWLWTLPDGSLVCAPLNYKLEPDYLFGEPISKYRGTWNLVHDDGVTFHRNAQQRIADSWMYGERGDKPLLSKASDPQLSGWLKRPLKIQMSTTAKTQGELDKLNSDELYDSVVGAVEFTLRIEDTGQRIRTNKIGYVHLPDHGLNDLYYIVGNRMSGGVDDGYFQEVRFREIGYALPRNVPDPPTPPKQDHPPDDGSTVPPQSTGTVLTTQCGVRWADSFVNAAQQWHKGSVVKDGRTYSWDWDLVTFLAVLLSICFVETKFQNVRKYVESLGHFNQGPEWYAKPDPRGTEYDKKLNEWYTAFANRKGNPFNPNPKRNAGVGPMQLVKPEWKQWADGHADSSGTVVTVKGRFPDWTPVGGTAFGGPSDPTTGYLGHVHGQEFDLRGTDSFAELSTNSVNGIANDYSALGDLPALYALRVRNPANGKEIVVKKRDVGFGQGDTILPGGHRAMIDLWYEASNKIGFDGYNALEIRDADAVDPIHSTGLPGEYVGGRWVPDANIWASAKALASDAGFGINSAKGGSKDPPTDSLIFAAVKQYNVENELEDSDHFATIVKQAFESTYYSCAQAGLSSVLDVSPTPTGSKFCIQLPTPLGSVTQICFPDMRADLEKVIRVAMAQLGVPYVWGGADPSGFDCSGLVLYAYKQGANVDLPHYTGDQVKMGHEVGRDELLPGDIVFFEPDSSGVPGHEGMYLNNNLIINAPHTGDVVRIAGMSEKSDQLGYVGARRILDPVQGPGP